MPLLGTSVDAIDLAEDRGRFGALLERLGYEAPPYATAHSVEEALDARRARSASRCSCARPTCSAAARWRSSTRATASRLPRARRAGARHAAREIFLDRFLENAIEVDVDALCDGEEVWIGGIMQHVEEAGDPLRRLRLRAAAALARRRDARADPRSTRAGIALALGVVGLINVQYAVARAASST